MYIFCHARLSIAMHDIMWLPQNKKMTAFLLSSFCLMNSHFCRVPYSLFLHSATLYQFDPIHANTLNYVRLQKNHVTSAHKLPTPPTSPPATALMKVQAIKLIVKMEKNYTDLKEGPQRLQREKVWYATLKYETLTKPPDFSRTNLF